MNAKSIEVLWWGRCPLCLEIIKDDEAAQLTLRYTAGVELPRMDASHSACAVEEDAEMEQDAWESIRNRLDPELDTAQG